MQQLFIWLGVASLVTVIFIPYLMRFRRDQRVVAERKKEAQAMGIDRPRAQFPMINRSLCIGCGSCVDACPEGDVIGVVWGVAEVINGERCVGHGYCETACPVGALRVGLGDIKSRPDIPILTPKNETTVPGLYIAGELGGLSLIRNAISQGHMVVDDISVNGKRSTNGDTLDLIIVGAGPAGLSAALTAIQHNLTYLVLDEKAIGGTILHYPRQKLVMTQPVEIPLYGWLKATEYSKEFLMETWHTIIAQFHVNLRTGERVESIKKSDDTFVIHTTTRNYYSHQVVLAMGRRGTPRRMEVSGEELPKVLYQLIDAQSFRGKKMLVVGGGDSAVEAAVGLARQPGNTVTISYRKNSFFRVKKKNEDAITKMIAEKKVIPLFESQVTEVRANSVLMTTKQGPLEIPNDFVIVQIGGIPPFEMLKAMGIAFGGEQRSIREITSSVSTPAHA